MMRIHVNEIVNLFINFDECEIHENWQQVLIKNKVQILQIPTEDDFEASLSFLNPRDKLQVSVVFDGEPVDFSTGNSSGDFINELSTSLAIKTEGTEIDISFTILKTKVSGIISSYFNNTLIDDMLSLELKGILLVLNQGFLTENFLLVESQTEEINIKTQTICISNDLSKQFPAVFTTRGGRVSKLNTVGHFSILSEYEYVPEDFYILESNHVKGTLLFNKLCELFSAGYLFDIMTIEDKYVKYNLNGYKSFSGEFLFKDCTYNNVEDYFKIYSWCYNEGNFNDKIGLARNIISLHIENLRNLSLKGNPYQSLLSSYKIYEKQNIKQYIEIRNKISEQLLSFNDKASKIVETFASGFQKSALALISFYISAIAIKLLGKGEFLNLFTFDATVLAVGFILCSLIYFFFASWEVRVQRQRFIDSYLNMKNRYLDLLDEVDINRILNNDKDYTADLKFIDDKKKNYIWLWLIFLGILLFLTLFLFFKGSSSEPSNKHFYHLV